METKLIKPELIHLDALLSFQEEFTKENMDISGGAGMKFDTELENWINTLDDPVLLKKQGYVPASTYLCFLGDELVGIISIRHYLNDKLYTVGGHIGYCIRRSKRNRGYGTSMLREALKICTSLDINEVIITCNKDNDASRKVILKNGGVFLNEIKEESGNIVLRFQIKLT